MISERFTATPKYSDAMVVRMQVCDALEDQMEEGGVIVDYHGVTSFLRDGLTSC